MLHRERNDKAAKLAIRTYQSARAVYVEHKLLHVRRIHRRPRDQDKAGGGCRFIMDPVGTEKPGASCVGTHGHLHGVLVLIVRWRLTQTPGFWWNGVLPF